jgi:hypothetical protein
MNVNEKLSVSLLWTRDYNMVTEIALRYRFEIIGLIPKTPIRAGKTKD